MRSWDQEGKGSVPVSLCRHSGVKAWGTPGIDVPHSLPYSMTQVLTCK